MLLSSDVRVCLVDDSSGVYVGWVRGMCVGVYVCGCVCVWVCMCVGVGVWVWL